MARKPSEHTSKVMDVSMPGKGAIMPTSRPVITPVIKDQSSESGKQAVQIEEVKTLEAPSASRRIILPISDESSTPSENEGIKSTLPIEVQGEDAEVEAQTIDVANTSPDTNAETVNDEPITEKTEGVEQSGAKEVTVEPDKATPEPEASPVIEETLPSKKDTTKPVTPETPTPIATDTEETPKTEQTSEKKPEVTDTVSDAPESSDAAGVDALVDGVETKKEQAKKAEEQIKKDAALEELIASKKYFVPIGVESSSPNHKKSSPVFIILLVLILVLLGAGYLAVDAKLLDVDIKLPYDLIKN
jgi:hypothetical protein